MANEEVLGPRKTMFVLVIVVGCFAVLWPRILSPLLLGPSREQLKSNQLDRDAGCCEVMFESELAILELLNEVCSSAVHVNGKLSPYAAIECRKAVNETCGVDIAAFLKSSENVGKSSRILVETMKNSNSSCLKEHFGVPIWSLSSHLAQNSWTQQDTLKQERTPIREAGPHPALRERGRAIPAGSPPPARGSVAMPPHVRPPPIPGMRPPLGSPGGPVPAPKSSMGFVMPIYTICIIVFFVYTLSKILFKRTGTTTYEAVTPDPQFRSRVFRDDSRSTPDKLVVTAISGLVAEVQQQMEANYAQNQQRQEVPDNQTRPYTNGTILHNNGPVHIVASEYRESSEKIPELQKQKEPSPVPEEPERIVDVEETEFKSDETIANLEESVAEIVESIIEQEERALETERETEEVKKELKEPVPETRDTPSEPKSEIQSTIEEEKNKIDSEEPRDFTILESKELSHDAMLIEKDVSKENTESENNTKGNVIEPTPEPKESTPVEEEEVIDDIKDNVDDELIQLESSADEKEPSPEPEIVEAKHQEELFKLTDDVKVANGDIAKLSEEFLREELKSSEESKEDKQSTPDRLEEAIKDEDKDEEVDDQENASVKHEAEEVKSIFLETEIPQQSRVLVAEFAEDRTDKPKPTKHSPMVVSGKMTLSLIQDAPRETPERDPESTVDDFTTASAVTQNAAEKEEEASDEEVEEEIEVEEIEEEVEEEEEEEPEPKKDKTAPGKTE